VYLSILVLLKGMKSVAALVPAAGLRDAGIATRRTASVSSSRIARLLPRRRRRAYAGGQAVREEVEKSLFGRLPGYALFRGLTQRLAGEGRGDVWKPALVEIEEGLVPGFIIEELDDGRYTVFVPSVPTPLAGAAYILTHNRVHPLNIPFAEAIKSASRWGSGAKDLVAAME
jgi:hypothetical protein